MEIEPQILFGKVMHKRFFPVVNSFTYKIYYFAAHLTSLDRMPLPVGRFGKLSFYKKDHGARDNSDLRDWIRNILDQHNIDSQDIVLIAMPRVLGYVFNPVSFWLCYDKNRSLRAVLCEVNNTFGETHSYLCFHDDHREISGEDCLYGEKLFHVSPFLEREGRYRFRFDVNEKSMGVWIDHYAADGRLQLVTALTGRLQPMTKSSLNHAFWAYPLVTLKAIGLIHWQAFKLLAKGVRYVPKPLQNIDKISCTHNITKM